MSNRIVKTALFLTGILSLTVFADLAQAQSSSGVTNTVPSNGSSISPGTFNNIRPVRQQNFVIDSGSGSRQFFRQGREKLYLLPEENSEPILKIDDTIEEVEANDEDLPEKRIDE